MTRPPFTVPGLSELLDEAEHEVRRTVDRLFPDLPRVGGYRIVPRELVRPLAAELERRRRLRESKNA